MSSYKEIVAYIKLKHGFVPDNCWIAHAKMASRRADGTIDDGFDISSSKRRCSAEKRIAVFSALVELGVL